MDNGESGIIYVPLGVYTYVLHTNYKHQIMKMKYNFGIAGTEHQVRCYTYTSVIKMQYLMSM